MFVDDFATRGLKETCAVDFNEALPDAYGALAYLSRLPYVDPARIAAVGFSQGGDTALKIASSRPAGGRAGVQGRGGFLSPLRQPGGRDACDIPTLILVGAKDEVTPAADCDELARRQTAGPGKLVVYPGAAHGFDIPEFGDGTRVMGMLARL